MTMDELTLYAGKPFVASSIITIRVVGRDPMDVLVPVSVHNFEKSYHVRKSLGVAFLASIIGEVKPVKQYSNMRVLKDAYDLEIYKPYAIVSKYE
jgi:hypothetical protein